jgi:hypothetical protein
MVISQPYFYIDIERSNPELITDLKREIKRVTDTIIEKTKADYSITNLDGFGHLKSRISLSQMGQPILHIEMTELIKDKNGKVLEFGSRERIDLYLDQKVFLGETCSSLLSSTWFQNQRSRSS